MNHVLMAVLLLASTPLLAGQRVASLEPECVRQHTCTPIQNHPRERLATGAECPVGSRVLLRRRSTVLLLCAEQPSLLLRAGHPALHPRLSHRFDW
jgi:hypothetical protein